MRGLSISEHRDDWNLTEWGKKMRKQGEHPIDWVNRIKEEIPDLQERIAYWQKQGSNAIFEASWELTQEKLRELGREGERLDLTHTRMYIGGKLQEKKK